jgi:hypothetical protein
MILYLVEVVGDTGETVLAIRGVSVFMFRGYLGA